MSQLLMDDYPVMVSPTLAELLGLNEAIFLQQVHYWLQKSEHFYDGYRWCYGTHEEWKKQLPFFSLSTLRRTISKLENQGILILGNYNKAGFDKTKWYTINYVKLQSVSRRCVQNEQTECSKWTAPSVQNEQTNTIDYTETTTETTNIPVCSLIDEQTEDEPQNSEKENFEKLWALYPNKKGKDKAFKAYQKAIKKGVTNQQIQAGILAYRQEIDYKKTDIRYIKHGSTWFNNHCWQDTYDSIPHHVKPIPKTEVIETKMTDEEIQDLFGGIRNGFNSEINQSD